MSELNLLGQSVPPGTGVDDPGLRHLVSPLSRRDYVRMADDTVRAVRGRRLLDWGAGYGQMSYLLRRRGLDVTSYDVGGAIQDSPLPVTGGRKAVRGGHPYRLPFRSGAFDAVLAAVSSSTSPRWDGPWTSATVSSCPTVSSSSTTCPSGTPTRSC